ncbi:MAG: hypothetical protein J0J06_10125 [Sphingomonas sp.]|uniref:hypothetical protein n=1 Tax=Sphingomonas sp. TaxID=28214 RepID=UPI001ACB4A12|nr:hypothetical protein [Sphingomonas sp.]MBN8815792.1 hypothetical protein [Sphingomonas sp.]
MIRSFVMGAATATLAFAGVAVAKQYVDYTPQKGFWQISAIEVDPNHIDDYLAGLRKSQVPGFEVLKKRGLMDSYKFLVRNGYGKGSPNVLIMTHVPSAALLDPDKARDEAVEKEILATFSEEQGKIAVAGYEKYRQFLDDGQWTEMTMEK